MALSDVETLIRAIDGLTGSGRKIIAIAGPPGAGKSTLASAIYDTMADRKLHAALVPMDGFHLDNSILQKSGYLDRKGAEFTFDANGFVHLIKRIRASEDNVIYPIFDRDRDLAIAGAGVVSKSVDIVLVEGNYLLLRQRPWQSLQPMFDLTIMLRPPLEELRRRLTQRWVDLGFDEQQAITKAEMNDIANAHTVIDQSLAADIVLT
ncbi:MAG: nucleoside/nucleotide kinase family protein [Pseudomonadota bacterium]